MTQIFIVSGTTWVVPGDWNNANNTIEVIGGGGAGGSVDAVLQRGGGGGGAYAKITNATVTAGTRTVQVGAKGVGAVSADGTSGTDTWVRIDASASAPTSTANGVLAKGGSGNVNEVGGNGGSVATSIGTVTKAGGKGATMSNAATGGGGGGGAGGPAGAGTGGAGAGDGTGNQGAGGGGGNGGGTAGTASSGQNGAAGGNNSGGSGSGAGSATAAASAAGTAGSNGGGGGGSGFGSTTTSGKGGDGGAGTDWDGTHGSGGGGGGAGEATTTPGTGGTGGNYGGGGGSSGFGSSALKGGDGATGLIAITYTAAGGAAPFLPNLSELTQRIIPPQSLRSWTWSYNQNLIALDVLPPGRTGITFERPSLGYRPAGPTWTWAYNQNLIAQDVFPPGRKGAFADLAPRAYPPPGKTWNWQYNLNLIAQDAFPPGKQIFERPPPVTWRRDWTQNLLLSTLSVVVQSPFNQYDWPLPRVAPQPDRTWVSSAAMLQLILPPPGDIWTDLPPAPLSWRRDWSQNLVLSTLVAQDQLPPGQVRSDRPQPVAWSQGWTQNLLLSTLSTPAPGPFNQFDWPLPGRAAQPDRTWATSFNPNLVGQDAFPPGQQRTDVPPPVSWRRDWTQSLVLSTLAGQDQLPNGVVSNRIIAAEPQQRGWTQNLLQSTLAPSTDVPHNQYDWPLPRTWMQPDRTFVQSRNLNLQGLDQLPVRQMDWPSPRGYVYPSHLRNAIGLNPNLFPPPAPPVVVDELRNPPFIGQTMGQMMTIGRW